MKYKARRKCITKIFKFNYNRNLIKIFKKFNKQITQIKKKIY